MSTSGARITLRTYRCAVGWSLRSTPRWASAASSPIPSLKDEDGALFDITPTRASKRYPFLNDEMTEEEFVLLITSRKLVNLDHNL